MGSFFSTQQTSTIPAGYAVVVVPFYSTLYTTQLVRTSTSQPISPNKHLKILTLIPKKCDELGVCKDSITK